VNIIIGNILDVKSGVIAHQVNCKGVMGAGLALQIRKKYPEVYLEYKDCCDTGYARLGSCLILPVDGLSIANLFAQNGYGRTGVHTDYMALSNCLSGLNEWANGCDIHIPYGIGCGLAGGDWDVVSVLIDKYAPNATVWKLP
jgi:hypothetical protein